MLLLLGRSYPSWEAVGPPAKVWAFATGLSHVGLRAGYWWASLLVSNTASPAWRFGATPDTGRGKDELAIGATGSFVGRGGGGGEALAIRWHLSTTGAVRERLDAKH